MQVIQVHAHKKM